MNSQHNTYLIQHLDAWKQYQGLLLRRPAESLPGILGINVAAGRFNLVQAAVFGLVGLYRILTEVSDQDAQFSLLHELRIACPHEFRVPYFNFFSFQVARPTGERIFTAHYADDETLASIRERDLRWLLEVVEDDTQAEMEAQVRAFSPPGRGLFWLNPVYRPSAG